MAPGCFIAHHRIQNRNKFTHTGVKGSGGVRKVRWAPEGEGKSGGVRAIYYWKKADHEIWMLTLYSKSERSSISGHVLKQIAEAIHNENS